MKKSHISVCLVLFIIMLNCAIAGHAAGSSLKAERERAVRHYFLDLQHTDYKNIAQLFEKDGVVISTSRGKVNAKEFFYSFLPDVASIHTEIHQLFIASRDDNHYAVRFHLIFKLTDGETRNAEYIDEFVFTPNSTKFSAMYMFENLKFKNMTVK